MTKRTGAGRERGHIRKRGNSYQVHMYAGVNHHGHDHWRGVLAKA